LVLPEVLNQQQVAAGGFRVPLQGGSASGDDRTGEFWLRRSVQLGRDPPVRSLSSDPSGKRNDRNQKETII